MPKILVIGPSWVGDMVMAQTLFKRLRERHSQLTLDVLAPAWTLALLQHMPEVDSAIANPFDHGQLRLVERYRFARTLRSKGYDQAIVLPNSLKSALIPWLACIPLRTGFVGEMRYGLLNDPRKLDKQALPLMVERFCQLAETPGAVVAQPLPSLSLSIDEGSRQATLAKLNLIPSKPVASFCIGAEYGPAKRWPPEHFAALANTLADKGYEVWLIGSMKDAAIGQSVEALSGGRSRNLCGKTNLSEAIDLLAASSVVVSNDSGLMHVAAALNRPMVALYGSSSPGFTPPLSDKARIVSLHLACSPCFKRECPLGHFNCMMKLMPERVAEELGKVQAP